jgi:hypothetical protein
MYPIGNPFSPQPERREPEPEQVEEVFMTDLEIVMHDPVLTHRAKALANAGLNPLQSRALALDRRVDTHAVVKMIKRGCPPHVAFDIASY